MKKHIRRIGIGVSTGAVILSMATAAYAAAPAAPAQQPNNAPGQAAPARPGRPAAPGAQAATPVAPAPAPAPANPTPPATQPSPAPGNNHNQGRPTTNPNNHRQGVPNNRPNAPTPVVPSARPAPAPGANHNNQGNNHHGTTGGAASRLGNSTLSNLVEYYENLVAHKVINQETATRAIDYMLTRYSGVSSNIGEVGGKGDASSIQFEQKADGGAMFFEQRADGKSIFFEQTPGKGAVYYENNPFGNVNELNAAIVHNQMVNEGVLTSQEAQAIASFDRARGNQDENK